MSTNNTGYKWYVQFRKRILVPRSTNPSSFELPENVRIFNYPGKMILEELSAVHRAALKTLKKIMMSKENPTEMEKMLVELCDANGDFSDKALISDLVEYVTEGK